jgi:hypothetical protein
MKKRWKEKEEDYLEKEYQHTFFRSMNRRSTVGFGRDESPFFIGFPWSRRDGKPVDRFVGNALETGQPHGREGW